MTRRARKIDEEFLERISTIEVRRPLRRRATAHPKRFSERGSRTWLIGVHELKDGAFPAEESRAERGLRLAEEQRRRPRSSVAWVRFGGNSRFRQNAKAGDSVIQIWTAVGGKRPRVLRPSAVLRVQKEAKCTRFYVEESPTIYDRSLSWTRFRELAAAFGWQLPKKVSSREIDPNLAETIARHWPKR